MLAAFRLLFLYGFMYSVKMAGDKKAVSGKDFKYPVFSEFISVAVGIL